MNNEQKSVSGSGEVLSDAAVEGLLRDFFRLEVPTAELSRLPVRPADRVVVSPEGVLRRSPGSRVAIAAALGVLALSLPWMFESGGSSSAGGSGGYAQDSGVAAGGEVMLPVSSGVPGEAGTVPLDENGLLLKETEGVELNPGRR
ncbi:MAG: hypothetical protein RL215_1759 [Planctomycetota bacterium]